MLTLFSTVLTRFLHAPNLPIGHNYAEIQRSSSPTHFWAHVTCFQSCVRSLVYLCLYGHVRKSDGQIV